MEVLDGEGSHAGGERSGITRYRTRRLLDEEVVKALNDYFERAKGRVQRILRLVDVDDINDALIRLCQTACELLLGRQGGNTRVRQRSGPVSTRQGFYMARNDAAASARLYKRICALSKENRSIVTTVGGRKRGLSAIEENLETLRFSYTMGDRSRALLSTAHPHHHYRELDDQCAAVDGIDDQTFPTVYSMEDIRTQIGLLDLDKSCGTDGIHVRFLHVLRDSSLVEGL